MLQRIEESLTLVEAHIELPKVIQVAAHAALMLTQKYHSLNDECEVYRIAMGKQTLLLNGSWPRLTAQHTVLSPDKNLQWFTDQGWDDDKIEVLHKEVISQWETSYKPAAAAAVPETLPNPTTAAAEWLLYALLYNSITIGVHKLILLF
jgi:hypothetical protein